MARKLALLSLHHIDTSVILEPPKTENGFYCKKYLNLVGYKYRGFLSFPVLSELFNELLEIGKNSDQWNFIDFITSLIRKGKISIYSPKDIAEIDLKIKEIDPLLNQLDRQIAACAIENKAILVTIDSKLVHNLKIEREFRIKIIHPKELI